MDTTLSIAESRAINDYRIIELPYGPMLLHKNEAAAHIILKDHEKEIKQLAGFITGTILDVGANLGSHSINWSRAPGVEKIWAFEPHPRTFLNLCANLLINGVENVRPMECALGAYNGQAMLSDYDIASKHYNMGSYIATKIDDAVSAVAQKKLLVTEIRTIDSFCLSPLHFIKIDTEGYEYEILRGATGTLRRESPIVFVEIHYEQFIDPIREMMAECGYEGREYFSYALREGKETRPLTWGWLYWKPGRIIWQDEL